PFECSSPQQSNINTQCRITTKLFLVAFSFFSQQQHNPFSAPTDRTSAEQLLVIPTLNIVITTQLFATTTNCNLLCPSYFSCGTQCISWQEGCANNRTICPRFYYSNTNLQVWSPQQLCYDSTTNACANGTTICPLSYTRLCGLNCWNPDSQYCINNSLQCINSCGGICYSNSQYCYNNAITCNNGQSVCDVTYNPWQYYPFGLNCYNSSNLNCLSNSLCPSYSSCGTKCLTSNEGCANNQTVCPGFYYWNANLQVCGTQQRC
ncbi:unnamed protein product, partial [Rotaria socialis]